MRPHPISRRRAAAGAIVALTLAVASTASAGQARDELIRPGVSIGKVRLGMTVTEVRRALGKPWTVVSDDRGFGRRALDLQYASLNVRVFGAQGRERVVVIESKETRERTSAGVGPGVLEAKLLRAQHGVKCNAWPSTATLDYDFYTRIGGNRTCFVDGPNGTRTIFVSTGPRVRIEGPGDTATRAEFERRWAREAKIELVTVRAAGHKLDYEAPPN
jgi:hypothetical protein